jgi:hypothetical protein
MPSSYLLSEIQDYLTNQNVVPGDFENLLSYYSNSDFTKITGNLNTGINIIIDDPSLLRAFHVTTDMFWPQISQKIYGTDSLYWFLMMLNPYATQSPFGKVKAPFHIMFLPSALQIIRNANS